MVQSPHLHLAKNFWKQLIASGDTIIDATCGNGHDTLFLAKLPISALFSLDIQAAGIEKTRELLSQHLNEEEQKRVTLYQRSHEQLQHVPYPKRPRLIVYNLGYLPGGDKSITTKTESTLSSIESALSIVEETGAISITCYPGHPEGEKEEQAILQLVSSLPSHLWEVQHHRWINRVRSPNLFWIARL